IHATCEDYRAGATIDLAHSREDGAKRVICPLLVLWGERGTVGRLYDVMKIWRAHGRNVTAKAPPAVHCLPQEWPANTLWALPALFQGQTGVWRGPTTFTCGGCNSTRGAAARSCGRIPK